MGVIRFVGKTQGGTLFNFGNPLDENGNPIYGGMPKWGIFQLSSLVKINSKTYLQVLLDNIFDIHYREFASGISSPGRSLNLKLTLN